MMKPAHIIAALLVASPLVAGQVWVDAANGNNVNGGTSAQDAWRTITFALDNASEDATVFVLPGLYNGALGEEFPLEVRDHSLVGVSGSAVTTLEGPSFSGIRLLGVASGGPYPGPLVEGFHLQGFTQGIRPGTGYQAQTATFRDITILGGAGFSFSGFTFISFGLEFENVHTDGLGGLSSGIAHSTRASSSGITIRDSSFRNHSTGIHLLDDQGLGGQYLIERCLFSGNTRGASVGVGGVTTIIEIVDSVFVDNEEYGLRCGDAIDNNSISRCTIAGNTEIGLSTPVSVDCDIEDCIIWGNGMDFLGNGVIQNSNLEDSSFAGQNGNISEDPLFRDPALGDYRLSVGSPSIDRLAPAPSLPVDLTGALRNVDGDLDTDVFRDHGAYEFQPLELVGEPSLGSTVELVHFGEPGTHGVLFSALDILPQPLPTRFGLLELDPGQTVGLSRLHFSPTGMTSVPFFIPDLPMLIGSEVHFQSNIRSSEAPSAFALTNRATLVVEP